jgi:hypothetical protein
MPRNEETISAFVYADRPPSSPTHAPVVAPSALFIGAMGVMQDMGNSLYGMSCELGYFLWILTLVIFIAYALLGRRKEEEKDVPANLDLPHMRDGYQDVPTSYNYDGVPESMIY